MRLPRPWIPTVLALLACACASTGGRGAPLRVALYDYRGDRALELAGESHTDRVAYYSVPRSSGARKVVEDRVVQAFFEELERRGFSEHAQDGPAPRTGGDLLTWGFEVERGSSTRHWVVGKGSAEGERRTFQEALQIFVQLYNSVISFQTIDNPAGRQLFEEERERNARALSGGTRPPS